MGIKNDGTETETFTVTTYYGSNVNGAQTIKDLTFNSTVTLFFSWNTTGVPLANYTIFAIASQVLGEADTTDKSMIDGSVQVRISARTQLGA